jgi:hypothetical protein
MKRNRKRIAIAGALFSISLSAATSRAADVTTFKPPPATAPASRPTTMPATPLSAILSAPDPSAVVQAYSHAAATQPGNIDLEKAYIHRMVELNVPEMADLQARNLVQRDGSDGVAWAVVGYMAAARGAPAAAIENLKIAVQQSPDDPFVLRTCAQVVAWYDSQTNRSMLSRNDVSALEWIRAQGAGKPAYADAYADAQAMRRNWRNPASTQPATQPNAAAQPTSQPIYDQNASAAAPIQPPLYNTYSYPAYSDPYASYPVYPAYPYMGGAYWYSPPGIIILRDHDFHHHLQKHDLFDGGFFHDGRFHHNEFGHHDFGHHDLGPPRRPIVGPQPRISVPHGSFDRSGHTFNPPAHPFGPRPEPRSDGISRDRDGSVAPRPSSPAPMDRGDGGNSSHSGGSSHGGARH